MWQSLYRNIKKRIIHPIKCDTNYLTRRINVQDEYGDAVSAEELVSKVKIKIEAEERRCIMKWLIRSGAILSIVWSVFLLYNESMLFFGNVGSVIATIEERFVNQIWVLFLATVLIMSGTVFAAFLTIFKLKFSDYLQLVPKLTDPVTFCSFTSLFSKVIAVACFNFMVMAGEVQIRID